MKELEIRKLEKDEINEVTNLIREGFSSVAEEYNLTKENAKGNGAFITKDRLLNDLSKGVLMYGGFFSGELVGYVQLQKKNNNYNLQHITVSENSRGRGFGLALINFSKEKVKELQGDKISLGFIDCNLPLRFWYEKQGLTYKGSRNVKNYPYKVGFMEYKIK